MKDFNKFFKSSSPFIIAEAGVNHGGNYNLAVKYIKAAKKAGADAIKFQTYKAELIASKDSKAYWDLKSESTKNQYDLFKKFDSLNYEDYSKLKKICDKEKILFMTTLFDTESVQRYDKFLKIYKISSSDITNIPLLRAIGLKKKPVILSTGASTVPEIKRALKILNMPKSKICIMHCVLNYPTENKNANLMFINKLKKFFPKTLVGYSDHTKPDSMLSSLLFANQLGAKILEKHFTLSPNKKGNDHYHSMTQNNLKKFKDLINKKNILMGLGSKNLRTELKSIMYARRGIYAKIKIKKGDVFTVKNIIPLRPAFNTIKVEKWDKIIGRKANKNYNPGEALRE